MKVLIYGGSFDPVHKGHSALLKAACRQINPDKVHIFTAFQSPFKPRPFLPFQIREKMAKAALGGICRNMVFDDFEQKAARVAYTYETVEHIKKLYPSATVYLLLGTDCLESLHKWKNADYIFKNAVIVAGKRRGFSFKTDAFSYILLDGHFPLISSTNIRLAILCNGLTPTNLLPQTREEIEKNSYYGLHIHKWLAQNLRPNRYLHVKLVAQAAVELAILYKAPQDKLALAGILHDAAKSMDSQSLIQYAKKYNLKIRDFNDICRHSPSLLHAAVSADIAKRVFRIKDPEILNPIRNHTLGALNMGLNDKLLFIADMASKDRRRKDSQKVHNAALVSIEEGMKAAMLVKLDFTLERKKWLAPAGIELWNQLVSGNR